MAGLTNHGKYTLQQYAFQGATRPTNFYWHLVNSTPTDDTNVLGDLTEASNYTALSKTPNGTNFPATEDDTNDRSRIDPPDLVWTASGGTCTCTYAVLCDDNGTPASRIVFSYHSLGGTRNISDGQTLTASDAFIDFDEGSSGFTNRGKYTLMQYAFQGATLPTSYYWHLLNSTPTADTNILGDVTEASNYSALAKTPNGTNFPATEDDSGNRSRIDPPDLVFTASGGQLTCTYAVLCDDNGTPASRIVFSYHSLGGTQNVSDGNTLTVQDAYLDFDET